MKTITGTARAGRVRTFPILEIALLCSPLLVSSPLSLAACLVPGVNPANLTGDLSDGVCATAPTTTLTVDNLTTDIAPAAGDDGISLTSRGGNGGGGVTLPIHGTNGSDAGNGAGLVASMLESVFSINTTGDNAHGVYVSSVGGNGGTGGGGFGIIIPIVIIPVWFPGFGGDGGDGGDGGNITVLNNANISTQGIHSYGIYATSRGGTGGDGGWGVGLYGEGGDGGYGGRGGNVAVTNNGTITTQGFESHGLFAESEGGAGGDGGSGWGVFGSGADGGGNADSGTVTVTNSGFIETRGLRADAIHAWSIGGGKNSGGGAGGIFSWGGDGAAAGHGNTVTVNNTGSLVTRASEASGIYAESTGGGGGNGGNSGSVGPYLSVSVGGSGGPGGNGSTTSVTSSIGTITTGEDPGNPGAWNPLVRLAHGIFASSKGGGGGQGGFAFSIAASDSFAASFAFGGSGGFGGHGGNVLVDNQSALTTYGDESHGIFAQSLGGGGGNGGFAFAGSLGSNGSLSVAFGGRGGLGGNGSLVTVDSSNLIHTYGIGSYGIFAQSVGGGGGSGGDSIAISGSGVASGSLSVGGSGGGGGHGGALIDDGSGNLVRQGVIVNSSSVITTAGDTSHGILAQSVGGGGGEGGMAISGSFASTGAVAVALGGGGGTGGDGGRVDVTNSGTITTSGYKANGIYAQSTGKGGGIGGMSVSVTGTFNPKGSAAFGVSLGGSGGGGGKGDRVSVVNDGTIITSGDESAGIKAQSVGGGGGDGGFSFAGGISGPKSLNAQVAIGGSGGSGNSGGEVDVVNNGQIMTSGFMSHGIFAESVGGGGGTGGSSVTATLGLYDKTVGVGVSLGGGGGGGAFGQKVSVTNNQSITTLGNAAYGIFAQSVGGGGGVGGAAYAGSAALSHPDAKFNMGINVALGGSGGTGGHGGAVDLLNSGLIETWGINAHGIYGQSVGGGGGVGGNARTMSLSQCWWECSPKNVSLAFSMGGAGGAAGDGGSVTITNEETIITHGTDSHGIWAQSVGGGGGTGGDGAHGFWGVPTVGISKNTPYLDVNVAMGGSQGASGDGGAITVVNNGGITTLDDGSFGVYAQSVGGGGGHGGHGAIGLTGKVGIGGAGGAAGDGGAVTVTVNGDVDTSGGSAHGIFAQSVGGGGGLAGNIERGLGNDVNFGIGVGITKNGGNGGNGGAVTVNSTGNITTRGQGSMGIFAQSVGGGGGLAGDNGTGFAFSGSAGGDGAGGTITVNHTGDITTLGDNSHGIFAQSGGGAADNVAILDADGNIIGYLTDLQDTGGDIDIVLDGSLYAHGADANGIFLQSQGADGNGDIDVTLNGMVQGGTGDSAGVRILDGAANTLAINGGTVTTLNGVDGTAIFATGGDETVDNAGTVTGSVELGAGTNGFNNLAGSLLNSGDTLDLGGGAYSNAGVFAPGAGGRVLTTDLAGDYLQSAAGNYALDLDFDNDAVVADRIVEADRVNVTGTAALDGILTVSELNLGYAREEVNDLTVVSAGTLNPGSLQLDTLQSIILKYELLYPNANDVVLRSTVDFSPDPPPGRHMKKNQLALAGHIANIQTAGGSQEFSHVAAALFRKPDFDSLMAAYDRMIPSLYLNADIAILYTSLNFHNTMFSCPQRTGDHRFIREGECSWISLGFNELDYEDDDLTGTFQESTVGVSAGMQRKLDDKWHGGFGIALEQADLDSNGTATSDGDRIQAGVAFKRSEGPDRLTAALSVGYGTYDSVRVVDLSVPGVAATSDQDIWFGAAHLRYSRDREYDDWYLRPSIDAGVTHVRAGSFTESGAGGANLQVDSRDHTVFTLEPAIEVGNELAHDGAILRPYARLGLKLFSDTDPDLTATLQGAPAGVGPFRTEGSLDSVVANVSAGVNILTEKGYTWRIGYAGQFSERIEDHAASIKVTIPF